MWHASSRSGVATLRTAIGLHLLLTYLLANLVGHARQRHELVGCRTAVRLFTRSFGRTALFAKHSRSVQFSSVRVP